MWFIQFLIQIPFLKFIQFSKILQQLNKELKSPLVSIYISGYQIDIVELDDFETCLRAYQDEREQTVDLVLKNFNENIPI